MTWKTLWMLIVVAFFSCEREALDTNNYDEESPIGCLTCDGEQVSEIYRDVDAVVTTAWPDPIKGTDKVFVFTISKADLSRTDGTFSLSQDSILVPCKRIPAGFEVVGKKVKISGQLMSCGQLLDCPQCRIRYGRKFVLTRIQ